MGLNSYFLSGALNPIELCWSKFKSLLQHAEARTRDELDADTGLNPNEKRYQLHVTEPQWSGTYLAEVSTRRTGGEVHSPSSALRSGT